MTHYKGLYLNQEITFWYTYPGGYGRTVKVNGKVLKLNPKRCRVVGIAIKNGVEYERITNICYTNIIESEDYFRPTFLK